MAKLTREQFNKINAACKNGFMLDLRYFAIWSEKQLIKNIEIDDLNCYEVVIGFHEVSENFRKVGEKPFIRFSRCNRRSVNDVMWTVSHLKTIDVDDQVVARKNMKLLYALTEEYTDKKALEVFDSLKAA